MFDPQVTRNDDPAGRRLPPAINRALKAIDGKPLHRWSVDELSQIAGVGKARFQVLFKKHVGISPIAYARRHRLREGQRRLRDTDHAATKIAVDLGFSSSQHFATAFRQHYGLSPTAYREAPHF